MNVEAIDRLMMGHCIGLSKASGKAGEYPYAAVICRDGMIVAESINRVTHAGDVTRHAEVAAISQAQKMLGTVSLEDCEVYECGALYLLLIRDPRDPHPPRGLWVSPHMGGVSKWNILGDMDICSAMPEVFEPPPEVVSGYMAKEAEQALIEWNPLIAGIIRRRGLFGAAPRVITKVTRPPGLRGCVLRFLRRNLFDYFGRR